MAVTLRLMRKGSKHRPFYHLVAIDSRKRRKFLEQVGIFGHGELRVDQALAQKWLGVGAQASVKVRRLIRQAGLAADAAPAAATEPRAAAPVAATRAPAAAAPGDHAEAAAPPVSAAPVAVAADPAPPADGGAAAAPEATS